MAMDEDDEFGDLYTDLPHPVSSSFTPPLLPPPSDTLTAGNRIPLGNPNSHSSPPQTLAPSLIQDPNDDWLPDNWNDDDEDDGSIPAAGDPPATPVSLKQEEEEVQEHGVSERDGFRVPEFEIGADLEQGPVIPGLSSALAPTRIDLPKVSNSEDWDSDSEDDLQIVLNDNSHHQHQMMMMGDDEDGEEDLVIVTDGDQAMEEQDWGELPVQAAGEGERKEGSEVSTAKANSAVGPTAGGTAARVGYGAHTFHPQHNSMYKYVRSGAAPGAPVVGVTGLSGQIRPPLPLGPPAGRGRGDWRPPGIRGTFHSGYPVPAWGNNSSGRGFGGGLDFTLPSHKTIFDVDLESFPEKPWKHPGVDISDYFNFGLDEDSWKGYSKQLDQLRIESTMQSKIRVYESGRSEQDYDPDLPPELAVAAGHHDISTDNLHYGKIENGQIDLSGQGRGASCIRPQLPQGRPIQVETGCGERLPSIDTRPPRTRDVDAIIEIVLQDSMDDAAVYDGTLVQTEKDMQGGQLKGIHDVEWDRRGESEYSEQFPPSINGRKRERVNRRMHSEAEGDDILPFHPDSSIYSRLRSPLNPSGSVGTRHGGRLGQGASRGRCSSTSGDNSNDVIANRNAQVKEHDSHQKQKPGDSMEGNDTPEVSPDIAVETARELSIERKDDDHDDRLALADSVDGEGEDTSDFRISGDMAEDIILNSSRKQKLSSQVEHVVQDNGDNEVLKGTHSDNSRAKSGSSKEYQKQHDYSEVVQDGFSRRARDLRRRQEDEYMTRGKDDYGRESRNEMDRNRMGSKGRESIHNSYPYRHRESNSAHPTRGRSETFERTREPDSLFRQRREDDIHRRGKDEDLRKERIDEAGLRNSSKVRVSDRNDKDSDAHTKKRVDDVDWRGRHREGGLRLREKDDAFISRRENLDEHPVKRKKDDDHLRRERVDREDSLHGSRGREDSSRRRERDDIVDNRREDTSRMRGKPDDHHTSKHRDESWRHREREDRQRLKLLHEESSVYREREEGRGATRSGRLTEDKAFGGSGRSKNDSKGIVFDKDYVHRDKRRHAEQSTKGDHAGDENNHSREKNNHARERHYNTEGKSSRHERLSTHNDRPTNASDNHHIPREKLQEGTRKSKDVEGSGQTSQGLGKRKHEDHSTQQIEKVKAKGTGEQDSSSNPPSVSKKGHQLDHSSERHGEDIASDDENQQESRKGRSKLERWTSHKERDFSATTTMQPSLLSTAEKVEGTDNDVPTDELLPITEGNDASDHDPKGVDEGEITEKLGDDRDRHLDTVAKLKKRSERFKLPMPGEKDIMVSKKQESESQLGQTEGVADTEVKPERPARKRRWTGS